LRAGKASTDADPRTPREGEIARLTASLAGSCPVEGQPEAFASDENWFFRSRSHRKVCWAGCKPFGILTCHGFTPLTRLRSMASLNIALPGVRICSRRTNFSATYFQSPFSHAHTLRSCSFV
jgi:hypothetical protein